VHSKSGEVSA